MTFTTFRILGASFKRFNDDKCWTSAIVISYFALLCLVPLIALFFYVTTKLLGKEWQRDDGAMMAYTAFRQRSTLFVVNAPSGHRSAGLA